MESFVAGSPTLKERYLNDGRWATPEPTHVEGDDSDPGLASRRDCVLTATASRPEAVGWAPRVAVPLTTSLRGLWVSGLLPPGNGGTCKGAATLEPTKRRRGRLGPRSANPKRTQPNCHRKEVHSNHRGLHQRTMWWKGQEPWRRGAAGFCRLSRQLLVDV